jgi:hypothetical protein
MRLEKGQNLIGLDFAKRKTVFHEWFEVQLYLHYQHIHRLMKNSGFIKRIIYKFAKMPSCYIN